MLANPAESDLVVLPSGETMHIEYSRKSLGFHETETRTMDLHMTEMERKLLREAGWYSQSMAVLGLSYASLVRFVFRRTQASALHLAHLACHAPVFAAWANGLQHKCLARLLGLRKPVARCISLVEHDVQSRLSVETLIDAVALWNRIYVYEKNRERETFARKHGSVKELGPRS